MFNNCFSLEEVPALSSAAAVTTYSTMFYACCSLKAVAMTTIKNTFSVASCQLSGAQLDLIYTNLATVAKTITITGNWGATSSLTVGTGPYGVAVTPNGAYVYVVNFTTNNVKVIRTSDNTVTATITVGNGPFGVAVTPDGAYVYVANYTTNNVSVIRTSDNLLVTECNRSIATAKGWTVTG